MMTGEGTRRAGMVVLALGLCLAVARGAAGAESLTLVERGEARAAIVLGAGAVKAARFGAVELQHHVREMTGAELPIVTEGATNAGAGEAQVRIYIGDTARARALGLTQEPFRSQEYVIQGKGHEIFLVGLDAPDTNALVVVYEPGNFRQNRGWPDHYDAQGSLHAVYHFLEESCGVRWFNEYPSGTLLPRGDTLRVNVKAVRRTPSFIYRQPNGDQQGMWKKKTDEHAAYLRAAYPELAVAYSNNPAAFDAGVGWMKRLYARRQRAGGENHHCNHSFYSYYPRFCEAWWQDQVSKATTAEATNKVLERKQARFEGDRPEFFARGHEETQPFPPQLCYVNPGLIEQVVQDARDYVDGKKTGKDLGVWFSLPQAFPLEPMDNGSFCQCDACAALIKLKPEGAFFDHDAVSDYHFRFVNEVAERLRRTHPDAALSTLAYAGHAGLPSFPLAPNVTLTYCFTASDAPDGSPYYENGLAQLRGWADEARQSGRTLFLWLYNGNQKDCADRGGGAQFFFPPWTFTRLGAQIQSFHKLGYRGSFGTSPFDVDQYLFLKLFMDHTADPERLAREYFEGLYGPAAEPLRALCEDISRRYLDSGLRPEGKAPPPDWQHLGTAEKMAEWQGLMDRAKALAATERERRNVELLDVGAWGYMREGRNRYEKSTAGRILKPSATACPRMLGPAGAGDPERADWLDAQGFGNFYGWLTDHGETTLRAIRAAMIHDGQHLYLRFVESNLERQPAPGDAWEIALFDRAANRVNKLLVDAAGAVIARTVGDNVPQEWSGHGARAVSRVADGRWTVHVSLPIASLPIDPTSGRLLLNVRRNDASGGINPVMAATGGDFDGGRAGLMVSLDPAPDTLAATPPREDLILDCPMSGDGDVTGDRSAMGNAVEVVGEMRREEGGLSPVYYGQPHLRIPVLKGLVLTNFTFSIWIHYPNGEGPGGMRLLTLGDFIVSLGRPHRRVSLGWTQGERKRSSGAVAELTEDAWHQVVVTGDGQTFRLYQNGRPRAEVSAEGFALQGPEQSEWRIGGKKFPFDVYYGTLGHVRFYKRALAPSEVMGGYAAEYRARRGGGSP